MNPPALSALSHLHVVVGTALDKWLPDCLRFRAYKIVLSETGWRNVRRSKPAGGYRAGESARWAFGARMMPSSKDPGASSLSLERLIRACIDTTDTRSWEEFVRLTHDVIAATIFRVARRFGQTSPALIADLVQNTYLKICENRCRALREFHAEFPEAIFGLMKTIAFSVAHDHFRAELTKTRGGGHAPQPLDSRDKSVVAGGEGAAEIQRQVLLREIDDFLLAGGSTDRRIFWLYYRHGLTSRAIAALPEMGLTQSGVESAIYRLTLRVRQWLSSRKNSDEKVEGKAEGSSL